MSGIWPRFYRRHPIVLVVCAMAAVLLIWSCSQQQSDYEQYHNKTFTCVHVADGDTIDINVPDGKYGKTRIRLWGVDTPETAKSPHGEMYFGPQASAYTKSVVLGKAVRIQLIPGNTRDKYDRLLAYVYVGDEMLNELLIANGYAYADRRFKHPWQVEFNKLEDKARSRSLGLWKDVTPDKMPPWRRRYETWRTSQETSSDP